MRYLYIGQESTIGEYASVVEKREDFLQLETAQQQVLRGNVLPVILPICRNDGKVPLKV
jgi:hypothetical protein